MSQTHASIDALISPILNDLRERWWDHEFTEFLTETLRPRPGNRILDVGCGVGTAEVHIGRLHVSQIDLFGIDIRVERVIAARHEAAAHNLRAGFAAADACHLPFVSGAFDSTFCVAVLQRVCDVDTVIAELARVTRPGGRVVAVEPDNAARFAYSSLPAGMKAFEAAARVATALAAARGDTTDRSIGPKLPALFARHGLDPLFVRLFPVSHTRLGAPAAEVWAERRSAVGRALEQAVSSGVSDRSDAALLGAEYAAALQDYEAATRAEGPIFVEIQHTMLFATVGQRENG